MRPPGRASKATSPAPTGMVAGRIPDERDARGRPRLRRIRRPNGIMTSVDSMLADRAERGCQSAVAACLRRGSVELAALICACSRLRVDRRSLGVRGLEPRHRLPLLEPGDGHARRRSRAGRPRRERCRPRCRRDLGDHGRRPRRGTPGRALGNGRSSYTSRPAIGHAVLAADRTFRAPFSSSGASWIASRARGRHRAASRRCWPTSA
jgi:hypothetical protein